jgi:hypothetical protein
MSIQQSRFEGQQVINAFNLFIDSEKGAKFGDNANKGDDYNMHFEGLNIEADAGSLIRLTLLDFTMMNNLYDVDHNNRRFTITGTGSSAQAFDDVLFLPCKNHRDLGSLADDFANLLKDQLLINANANGSTADAVELTTLEPVALSDGNSSTPTNEPTVDSLLENTGTRLFRAVIQFKASGSNTAHNLTALRIQFPEAAGEAYLLMGGERKDANLTGTDAVEQAGLKVALTTSSSTAITVEGYYPMQRTTKPNIYLRADIANNALMSQVLDSANGVATKKSVRSGNILAKIPINRFEDPEMIRYVSRADKEYFIDLYHKRLSSLRLFLTDARGNPLGRLLSNSLKNTAAGLQSNNDYVRDTQTTLGNLAFDATIRIEIVRVRIPQMLDTIPPAIPTPAREAQSILEGKKYYLPRTQPF